MWLQKFVCASLPVFTNHLGKLSANWCFCTNLDTLMDHINNELPICSFITGGHIASCTKWCNEDVANSVVPEIDTPTLSAGYKQIINKPTQIVNRSSSYIDLIFCNNLKLISTIVVLISHYLEIVIIMSFWQNQHLNCPHLSHIVKCGIIAKKYTKMLKIYKRLFEILIGKSRLKIFLVTKKSIFWMEHYWTFSEIIFQIKNRKNKFNYCQPL